MALFQLTICRPSPGISVIFEYQTIAFQTAVYFRKYLRKKKSLHFSTYHFDFYELKRYIYFLLIIFWNVYIFFTEKTYHFSGIKKIDEKCFFFLEFILKCIAYFLDENWKSWFKNADHYLTRNTECEGSIQNVWTMRVEL